VETFLELISGLLIVACAFLVLWIAFSPLILKVIDTVITPSVPAAIGSGADD
jgi:uncharacterized membrane protein